jgi:hypothetical protein
MRNPRVDLMKQSCRYLVGAAMLKRPRHNVVNHVRQGAIFLNCDLLEFGAQLARKRHRNLPAPSVHREVASRRMPASYDHVPHVLPLCPKVQMIRIHTVPNITAVQHKHSVRDRPVRQLPRHPVRSQHPATNMQPPVAPDVVRANPQAAPARVLTDLRKESTPIHGSDRQLTGKKAQRTYLAVIYTPAHIGRAFTS